MTPRHPGQCNSLALRADLLRPPAQARPLIEDEVEVEIKIEQRADEGQNTGPGQEVNWRTKLIF